MNKIKIISVLFLAIFVMSFVSAEYVLSNPKFTEGTKYSSFGEVAESDFLGTQCQEGQDFIVQVDPTGCTPSVVRSDLLEEQDVPVYCKLKAIKVNPFINIQSIDGITFSSSGLSSQVQTVGFVPSYSALGDNRKLNNLMWDDIGYLTVILNQQPNESALTNCEKTATGEVCWVEGKLKANIQYDLEGGFGLRRHTFYLPIMTDEEFEERMGQYSFFDQRGYLRAENVESDSATISVYSGALQKPYKSGESAKQKLQTYDLKVDEKTSKILLPGLDCLAGVQFKLDEIDVADTRARLSINSEVVEVSEDEKFLGDKCSVREVEKNGLNQRVRISCEGDVKSETFELSINPSVVLKIKDGNSEEQVTANIGDRLYVADDGNTVYLGYAGFDGDDESNLEIYLVSLPENREKLTTSEISAAAFIADSYKSQTNNLADLFLFVSGGVNNLFRNLVWGESFVQLSQKEAKVVNGRTVSFVQFGLEENSVLDDKTKSYYKSALSDYEKVLNNFATEKYPESDTSTLGERSLYAKIQLAKELNQKADMKEFCNQFLEKYSDSNLDSSICTNLIYLANEGISTKDILIDGDYKTISFERVYEPSYKDYGAEIGIKTPEGKLMFVQLQKNKKVYLGEKSYDFIKLTEVGDDYVEIQLSIESTNVQTRLSSALTSSVFTLNKDTPQNFGSKYTFTLRDTNLKRVAKVVVDPSINYAGSEADFSFKIGVEKRSIQLSPEKTKSMINKLNKTIETWEGISDNLGGVVKGMKTACLATGAVLTLKNLVMGVEGKSIARQAVMKNSGGWYEICSTEVEKGTYSSLDQCYLKNSDKIDTEVNQVLDAMTAQNQKIKSMEKITKDGLFEKVVDTDLLAKDYSSQVKQIVGSGSLANPISPGESVNLTLVSSVLNEDGWKNGVYDIEDLKKIDLYANLLNKDPANEMYAQNLYSALKQIENNGKYKAKIIAAESYVSSIGLGGMSFKPFTMNKNQKQEEYEGYVLSNTVGEIPSGSAVQGISFNGEEYLVTLKDIGSETYRIDNVYTQRGEKLSDEITQRIKSSYSTFQKITKSSYKNAIKNAQVKYYETEPYKGLPAVVPVDVKNGWYAYLKHTLPSFGSTKTYSESGKVNSFYLCNVGPNGIEEFSSTLKDDTCQLVNLDTSNYNSFPGLSQDETLSLIKESVNAISEASSAYRDGVKSVKILNQKIEVGNPSTDSPSIQCSDYMSPKDCQLMFNLCDPVICPSSRCDFGGSYPVTDVVQSGIIGSIALCLPNWNEGIYVPVCLTGVKAGIDGLLSVTNAYRDCLQENLETGETVGICDQIHSIYLCEFFWKQSLPLVKIAIPKLLGIALGQTARGGGEYMGVESAWKNTEDSVAFFTEYYAVNAYKAFKARGQEQIGTEICKNFISLSYPTGQGLLDTLTESDSPAQFNARFEEIAYEDVTNPSTSQYKVYYHIYAGNDQGAYFKVYLRRGTGSSFYQDIGSGYVVASGYIGKGEYASETRDFITSSGLTELCVRVNDQEECGFKEVTTSFVGNYIKDEYLQSQANETKVTTEKECISGSASLYSMLNLNVQAGAENLISPEIYNSGIIRICSTANPGISSDPYIDTENQRWIEVGYCGDKTMKCWIDTDSIDDAMKFSKTENDTLKSLSQTYIQQIISKEGYLDEAGFELLLENISNEENLEKKIKIIDNIFDKVFINNEKADLFYIRGNIYGELAKGLYRQYLENKLLGVEGTNKILTEPVTISTLASKNSFVSPIFNLEVSGLGNDLSFVFKENTWNIEVVNTNPENFVVVGGTSPTVWDIGSKRFVDISVVNPDKYGLQSDLVKSLAGKNYYDGLKLLVEFTSSKTSGVTHDLVSDNAGMDYQKVFTLTLGEEEVYFLYRTYPSQKSEWVFGFSKFDLTSSEWSSLDKVDNSFETQSIYQSVGSGLDKVWQAVTFGGYTAKKYATIHTVPQEYKNLFLVLKDQDEITGAMILFSDKSVWDKLAEEKTNVPLDQTKILNELSLLEKEYNDYVDSGKYSESVENFILLRIEMFIQNLIDNDVVINSVEDFMGPGKINPNFPLIEKSIKESKYFGFGISGGESCEEIIVPEQIQYETDPRERVILAAKTLNGADATFGGSRGTTTSCWDAATYLYAFAGVTHSCVYSDSEGREYVLPNSKIVTKTGGTFNVNDQPKISCSLNKQFGENFDESLKLNRLERGDLISYAWNSQSGHNAIFIGWADKSIWNATLFDWNGEGGTYRFYTAILSDSLHPVYMYWEPVLLSPVEGAPNKYSISGTCSSTSQCQLLLGKEVMAVAKSVKDNSISDAKIQNELGVKSFECLSVMIAMQESSLQFCKTINKNGNPLYCEGDKANVLVGAGDYGIMQLSSVYFSGYNLTYFQKNIIAGLDKLKTDYSYGLNKYSSGKEYSCNDEIYSGWKYALRSYNGWNEDCSKGDVNYVSNVLKQRTTVEKLFPECSYVKTLSELKGTGWTLSSAINAVEYYESKDPTSRFYVGFYPVTDEENLLEDLKDSKIITSDEYDSLSVGGYLTELKEILNKKK